MVEITACPLCTIKPEPFIETQDYLVSRETFPIIKCPNCNLGITNFRPQSLNLSKYYDSEDYVSHTSKGTNFVNSLYLQARKYTLNQKFSLIKSLSNELTTILDYGCGTGNFLAHCQEKGWETVGIEPSEQARKIAQQKKLSIYPDLKPLEKKKFQIISLWHVLEHIPNFNEVIETLINHLEPRGSLLLALPNYDSPDAKHYTTYWAGYDVPRHLWHFNKKSVSALIEKHNLSLQKILPMKLDAFYVSLLSEKYKKANKIDLISLVSAFYNGIKSNWKAKKNNNFSSLIYVITK